MNVLYDGRIFKYQRHGGVSRYFAELAPRIASAKGVTARVLAPAHDNDYLSEVPRSVKIGWRTPAKLELRGGRRVERALAGFVEKATLATWRIDVLHETYYTEQPMRADRAARVVTVYDMIHELLPEHFTPNDPSPPAKRVAVKHADLLICISESTRRDLIDVLEVPPEKTVVIHLSASLPPPVDRDADARAEPYVLYVGRRDGYKNFIRLVEAMQTSPTLRGLRLVCFGGGAIAADERREIVATGFNPERIEQRFGSDAELARVYRDALCFVYPSLYEGFGIPPLEAMLCGCPVVCSDTSSIPEVVGEAGVYFDPMQIETIASAVDSVASSPTRRNELIASGTRQVARYSWERCARETLAAYRSVSPR